VRSSGDGRHEGYVTIVSILIVVCVIFKFHVQQRALRTLEWWYSQVSIVPAGYHINRRLSELGLDYRASYHNTRAPESE
jgi:hypothetical protein